MFVPAPSDCVVADVYLLLSKAVFAELHRQVLMCCYISTWLDLCMFRSNSFDEFCVPVSITVTYILLH